MHRSALSARTLACGFLAGLLLAVRLANAAPDASDPFLWLEERDGARARDWVKTENAKTSAVLGADPRYARIYNDVLRIVTDKDRIPMPSAIGPSIYNLWQDGTHRHGLWRRTTAAGYAAADVAWEPILDLDALSVAEHANWFWQDLNCREPAEDRCLIALSDGGEDASTVREFDLASRAFVAGSFVLPRGKQSFDWEDGDTLLVSREWNPGELTTSDYPYIVKRLKRGQPLSDAVEVFRGSKSDVGAEAEVFHDGSGGRVVLFIRDVTFFESETSILTGGRIVPAALPRNASIAGLVDGRLLMLLREPWSAGGTTFAAGSLVAVDAAALAADPARPRATLVVAAGARESIDSVEVTKSHAIVVSLDNVRGRAAVYTPQPDGGWSKRSLALPDNVTIHVADTSRHDDTAYLSVAGFLTPTTLYRVDAGTRETAAVKHLPAFFDAANLSVDQYEAVSQDGTRVPYFLVHRKGLPLDGSTPTILNAYGGFNLSQTPFYSGTLGKVWLERGGAFALANIRGGGEFGPAWHDAALKTHRQRAYDDFAAVAEDLITRNITSPRRLGIEGGSNGGLLMGVEMTQHPELFHAVDIQVPLLDMLRYEQLAAGSSWVGEYGSVANPEERAFLASISPYQNLKAGVAYPDPFIWTTAKDDRVGPEQARKFAAKLGVLGAPYLYYEVLEGGHNSGADPSERAHTTALEYVYFIRRLMD